jgi:hypothetical protein
MSTPSLRYRIRSGASARPDAVNGMEKQSVKKRHHRRGRHAAPRPARRYAVAFASAACLVSTGTAGVLLTGSGAAGGRLDTPTLAAAGLDVTRVDPTSAGPTAALDRAAGNDVSRDMVRPASSTSTPAPRGPVAGLDQAQTDNAATIIAAARLRGLSQRAMVVALATAMQESDLRNVASTAVPESLNYPHQGVEVDHDSVGLFQQRPSQGWGTVAELMDPAHSAGLFFDRLVRVPDWESMSVAGAAQAVQRSAFPDAYQQHQSVAERVVAALA